MHAPKSWSYALCLFLAAVIILIGNSPSELYPFTAAVSVFVFCCGLLYLVSGRGMFALSLSSVFIIVFQFINQLKVHYYKDQLMFSDFYIMSDPANLGTLLHYPFAGLVFIGFWFFGVLTGIVSWRSVPRRKGAYSPVVGICLMVVSGGVLIQSVIRYQPMWGGTLPGGTGVVSNLVMSARQAYYDPPTFPGGSSAYFKSRSAERHVSSARDDNTHPDIILLLQESTADPRLYQLPVPALLPHLSMFEQDRHVKAHSWMRVQTFGGGTWLSEFAILTGLRSDDFGTMKNAVFYSAIDHVNDSLFRQMKNNGYYTVVLTPFNKSAYNAGHAYHMMGVDKILQPQELGYPGNLQDNLWHISTADMLGYVKKILATYTNKPLFVYALTMYEHGPYDSGHKDNYQLVPFVKNIDAAGKFSHYVEKIHRSDAALADFFQFVDHRSKPTLFMYFGDHQPSIDWENGYTTSLTDGMHITQFSLRDNTDIPPVHDVGKITDIAFLGGILLEHARLKVSPFYQANIDMRHLCHGEMNECVDKRLFDSYRNYVYDELHAASTPR